MLFWDLSQDISKSGIWTGLHLYINLLLIKVSIINFPVLSLSINFMKTELMRCKEIDMLSTSQSQQTVEKTVYLPKVKTNSLCKNKIHFEKENYLRTFNSLIKIVDFCPVYIFSWKSVCSLTLIISSSTSYNWLKYNTG